MGAVIELARFRARTSPAAVSNRAEIAALYRLEAADLNHRAEKVMEAEAEYAGKAAGARRRGETERAAHFDDLQAQALACCLDLETRAFNLDVQATLLEHRVDFSLLAADLASYSLPGAR
jgi:hypothetical protein